MYDFLPVLMFRFFFRQTPEEGRRTYRPKLCENNNKDENNSPKTLNDKNPQDSSQKFRQLRNCQLPVFETSLATDRAEFFFKSIFIMAIFIFLSLFFLFLMFLFIFFYFYAVAWILMSDFSRFAQLHEWFSTPTECNRSILCWWVVFLEINFSF